MQSRRVRGRQAEAWMGIDRLVYIHVDEGASIELADAHVDKGLAEQVHGGVEHVLLIDMRGVKAISKAARSYYAKPIEESRVLTKAVAIVVRTPISRVIGNFFLGSNRPVIPVRMFSSQEAAVDWLRPFLSELS